MYFYLQQKVNNIMYIGAVANKYTGFLLPDRQTLRGDSRHEEKHY